MKKMFYTHLTEIEIIEKELDSLDLTPDEKSDLMHHVHSSLHLKVLDVVLSELPEEHKKTFLEHLAQDKHDEIWNHLLTHTEGIEEKIKETAKSLTLEFLKDIHLIKEKHGEKH